MKRIVITLFLFLTFVSDYAQENFDYYEYKYIGFQLLGDGPAYTIYFERNIYTKNTFSLNIKPQFEFIWGSDEDSIPRHFIPFFGLSAALGTPRFHVNSGVSTAMDISTGPEKNKVYFFHSLNIGPRVLLAERFLIGVQYNLFLRKPEFMEMKHYPHGIGFSLAIGYY